ncbi:hypothetical protein FOL47_000604 [Perkinsus chesapeaki]|uniref:Uncharacterized protein n=1 Tax=Perkinsus chesapeaki TaxID=330153 RepID=A0A7J6KV25_PERCH|nr:hypothetical protein FOL47_000604 [Perkinsus chesapeaki]
MPLASGPVPPRQRDIRTPPRMYKEPETKVSPTPTRNTDIHYWNRLDFVPQSPQRQGRSPTRTRPATAMAKSPQPRPLAHDARTILPDPPPPKTPPPPPRIFGPSDFIRNHLCPDRRTPLPPSRGGSRSRSVTPENRRRRTRRERRIVRGASPSPMRAERDTGLYTEWIAREMLRVETLEREVCAMEGALAKEFETLERNEIQLRDLQRTAVAPDMRASDSEKLAEAILAICAYKCFAPSFDTSVFHNFVASTLRSCRGIDPKVETLYQSAVRRCSGQEQTPKTGVQARYKSPDSSPEAPVLRAALKVIDEEAAKSSNIRTAIENGFGVVMKRKVHVRVVEEPDPAGGPPKRHVHFSAPDLDEKAAMEAITKAMEQGEAHPEYDVRSLLKIRNQAEVSTAYRNKLLLITRDHLKVVQRSPAPGPVGFKRASAVVSEIRNIEQHQLPADNAAPKHAAPGGFRRVGATPAPPAPKASGPIGFRKAGVLPAAKAVFGHHKAPATVGAPEQVVHAEYHREAIGVVRADMYNPCYIHTQYRDLFGTYQHNEEHSDRKGPVWPHVYRYPEAQPPPVIDTPIRRGHVTPSTQAQSADQSPSARSYSSTAAVVNSGPSVTVEVGRAVARVSRTKDRGFAARESGGPERQEAAEQVSVERKEATGVEEGSPEAAEGTVGEVAPTGRLHPKHGPVEGPQGQRVIHIMKHDLEEVTGVGGFWSSDSSLSDDAEAQLAKKGFRAQAGAKKALGIGMSSSVQEQGRRWSGRRASGSVSMRRSSTSSEPTPIWGRKSSR